MRYKSMHLKNILPALLLLFTLGAAADDGTAAYSFLNISSSARIYGLGGMNITLVDDDISVTDMNPALMGQEMSGTVALNYMRYFGGSNFAGARYGHTAGARGAWAAAIQYYGYGSMRETLPDGTSVGTFSPQDVTFSGLYSHDITDRLRGGIALKGIYSAYADYTAFALATDLGINYYDPDRDLSLSMVAANLGGQVKRFDQRYDRLPIDLRLGWSQTFGAFPVRFSITAWNLTRWKMTYMDMGDGTPGSEVQVKDGFASNLFRHLVFGLDLVASPNYYISLGYNYKARTDMATYSRSMLSGFSLGAGLRVSRFGLGIAYCQPHRAGTTLMLNLSYRLQDILQ